jgi:hypothetical protein
VILVRLVSKHRKSVIGRDRGRERLKRGRSKNATKRRCRAKRGTYDERPRRAQNNNNAAKRRQQRGFAHLKICNA